MSRRISFYILLISALSGCTLDDINQFGDRCPPDDADGQLSYVLTPDCNAESCIFGDFTRNFEVNKCPLEYAKCAKDENGLYYCSTIACSADEHVHNGRCQPNDLQNCGKHKYDCAQNVDGWKDGVCEAGSCIASSCREDYKLSNGRCTPLKGCPTGEHINHNTNACEPDTLESCGRSDYACTSLKGWVSGECVAGKCIATVCNEDEGYIQSEDTCTPLMTCDPDQHFYNKHCEDNDVNNCGGHGIACAYYMSGWKSGTCKTVNTTAECLKDSDCLSGFCIENECHVPECIATECDDIYDIEKGKCVPRSSCPEEGKHIYRNYCEDDDIDNCGDHNHQCRNTVEGWESGTCESGRCVPGECKLGYHLNGNTCELDTPDACGEAAVACEPGQLCSSGVCKDNCDSGSIRCVSPESVVSCADPLSSNAYCGADSTCTSYISCEEGQTCKKGACVQTSCPESSKTVCTIEGQPQCIDVHADDPTNCGVCNYRCDEYPPEHAYSQGCSSGICQYACDTGYKNCSTTDVLKCLEEASFASDSKNCGDCGVQCNEADEYCKNGHCLKTTCTNSCLDDGQCINTDTKCGTSCTNCNTANDASSGTCNAGSCKINACRENFHLNGNACVANTATSCAPVDSSTVKNCMTENNASAGQCVNGQCVATDCKSGYHVNNGKCVADSTTACGKTPQDCTKLTGWSNGTCQSGTCKASQCKSGYCLNGTTCVAGSSNASTCGTNGQACIACGNHYTCQNGICKLSSCDDNICFYNSTQCSNTNDHCGTNCTNCNTNGNATAGTCNNNGACTITSCKSGFHLYNNTCEADSVTHCGAHNYTCSNKVDGWSGGTCDGGTCKATSCQGTYHLYNNTCEADSTSHCGSHNNACSSLSGWDSGTCTGGQCKATACKSTHHLYNNTCEADSNTNCGSHGNTCQTGETCQSKVCKCPGGYTTVNGIKTACISSIDDFLNFRNAINNGNTWPADNTKKSYALTRSINLGTQNGWVGVGTSTKPFSGTFNGYNNTISGSLSCNSNYCGIFGNIGNYETSNIIDLRASVTISSSYDYVGGIIGLARYANLTGLRSSGTVSGKSYVGGIVGEFAPGTILNSTSSATVTASAQSAGGIVGMIQGSTIQDCNTSGTVTARGGDAGGIAGTSQNGVYIKNSYSTGKVTSENNYAGGLAGSASEGSITDSYSSSTVGAGAGSGGLAGKIYNLEINTSYHIGSVGSDGYAGGIAADARSYIKIYNSGAFGSVTGSTAGGLIGVVDADATSMKIQNNFTAVDLYGSTVGGMIGKSNAPEDSGSILDCNWTGAVFKGQSSTKGAVLNGVNSFKQNGPNFVYDVTGQAASNHSYSNLVSLSNYTLLWEGSPILTILKGECSSGWTAQSCSLSNGLAGPATYNLSIPPKLTPSNCH